MYRIFSKIQHVSPRSTACHTLQDLDIVAFGAAISASLRLGRPGRPGRNLKLKSKSSEVPAVGAKMAFPGHGPCICLMKQRRGTALWDLDPVED